MKTPASGRSAPVPDTTEPSPRAPGGELRALTGLRVVAAVWVVVFHFHFTPLPGVQYVTAWLGPLAAQGALGVDLFFVLSGFVIAYTHLDRLGDRPRMRATARFVWARAARMWPAYLVVFHLFGVWLWLRATYGSDADIAFQAVQPELGWDAWLRQLVLVQMWDRPFLDGASWVGPTWSISAEWSAYLLFPLTALVFFRLRRLPAVVLGVGALLAMAPMTASFLAIGTPYYPFSWLVRVLCGFSAGVLALLGVRRLTRGGAPGPRLRRGASVTATVAGLGIVGGLLAGGGMVGTVALLFPVLVGALALADRGPARLLASLPMVHGGRISYGLYLVHIPVFEVFWTALRHDGRFAGLLAPDSVSVYVIAAVVLTVPLGLAHLLYVLVEEPARGRMRDLPRVLRRSAPPAVRAPAVPAVVPVDTDRARLDPPTLRRIVLGRHAVLPRQADARLEVPRQDTGSPGARPALARPALARVSTAREAGHGDGPYGDGLAGNLLAAARLRASDPPPDESRTVRVSAVRSASRPIADPPARSRDTDRAVNAGTGRGADLGTRRGADAGTGRGADLGTRRGADVGMGRGADVGTGRGADTGTGRGAAAGSGWGADLGTGRGADTGTGRGADTGTGRGADAGTEGGADVGTGRAVDAGTGWGADAGTGSVAGGDTGRVAGTGTGPAAAEHVPEPRSGHAGGSRTGAERCGRSRHRAHGSAATPIVATAAASTRGRRRPAHGLRNRER